MPRSVYLQTDGDGIFLAFIVLLLFVGGSTFLISKGYNDSTQFRRRATLRGDVLKTAALVTASRNGHRSTSPSVTYEFTVDDVSYSGEASEQLRDWSRSRFNRGDSIQIRYLPSNPKINHPDGWEWSMNIEWFPAILLVFMTSLGGIAFVTLVRDWRLLRIGNAVAATVTNCWLQDKFYRVEYEFRVGNAVVSGKGSGKTEYEIDEKVWILYLAAGPRRNAMYPLSTWYVV